MHVKIRGMNSARSGALFSPSLQQILDILQPLVRLSGRDAILVAHHDQFHRHQKHSALLQQIVSESCNEQSHDGKVPG